MALPIYVDLPAFKASLVNGGGHGSRTAAELPDDRLQARLDQAHANVLGRLSAFKLPELVGPDAVDAAPGVLVEAITAYAAYTSTLEWNNSQPLEDRDPVALTFALVQGQVRDIVAGRLVVDGLDPVDGVEAGDPETYQQTPALGLASGLFGSYGGGYDGDNGRGWAHGW